MPLNHIGTQIIETNRLILRKFYLDDAKQMYDSWAGNSENVKYVTWKAHKNIGETKEIISKFVSEYENSNCYRWAIVLRENNCLIGDISVVDLSEGNECCEIGYILSKKYWNMGIMTEALHAVLKFLFEKIGFHRVQLCHDVNNPASGRVAQKNGFKYEGTMRHARKTNTESFCDTALYSILNFEF